MIRTSRRHTKPSQPSGHAQGHRPSQTRRLSRLRRVTRAGFSLVELVVAIGILVIMIALAGQVFSISVKSTGEATALIDVNQSLRQLEETLREDLAGIDPARSMMVIWSQPINAYWTRQQQELDPTGGNPTQGYLHNPDPEREDTVNGAIAGVAGSPPPFRLEDPRADILMFFTTRRTRSNRYPQVFADQAQVLYGHAELGEIDSSDPNGGWLTDMTAANVQYPVNDPVTWFERPAQDWHLARRSVALVESSDTAIAATINYTTGPPTDLPDWLDPPPAPSPEENNLRDGIWDFIVRNPASPFQFNTHVVGNAANIPTLDVLINWMQRSRLDLEPPARFADRLGSYFLANCASFKVEWTFADPLLAQDNEVLWVDSTRTDATGAQRMRDLIAEELANPPPNIANIQRYQQLMNSFALNGGGRFDEAEMFPNNGGSGFGVNDDRSRESLHSFYARDHGFIGGTGQNPDPFFPTALRITVDVFDDAGRFERPIRHVMILPVGGGV